MQVEKPLRVLVACEFSGVVRRAFTALGHDTWSCDLLRSEDGSNRHIQGNVLDYLNDGWDLLMVAHPPCTRLCNSGVRWLKEPPTKLDAEHYSREEVRAYLLMNREERLAYMWDQLDKGAEFFSRLWNAPIERVAVENPVMHHHAKERIRNFKPATQTVQPWWFGAPAFKGTGLTLRGLPALVPTKKLTPPRPGTEEHKRWSHIHLAPPGPGRWKIRSRTFPEIAEAMASQWGGAVLSEMARAA